MSDHKLYKGPVKFIVQTPEELRLCFIYYTLHEHEKSIISLKW